MSAEAGSALGALLEVFIADRTDHVGSSEEAQARDTAEFIRGSMQGLKRDFCERDLALTGHDLHRLGITGHAVGTVKRALAALVVDGSMPNDRDAQQAYAQAHLI